MSPRDDKADVRHFTADKTSLGYRRLLRETGLTFRYVG